MVRFEIVAHVVRDIECESFEEAVTIVKDQLGAEPELAGLSAAPGGLATGTVTDKLGAAPLFAPEAD